MRRAYLVQLLLGVVACAHAVPVPPVPAPPLEGARMEAVFDPGAQVEGRPSAHDETPLQVLDLQPVDRSQGEPIRLRFDRPVAAQGALPEAALVVERQRRDGGWTSVAGQSTWARTDRLRFDPKTILPAAHRIRVRLEGSVEGIEGVSWTFETPPPAIDVLDDWQTLQGDAPLRVWCDEPLSPEVLAAHLKVTEAGGDSVSVTIQPIDDDELPTGSVLEVRPKKRWPRGGPVRVEVDASFRSDEGVLPLGEPAVWSLATLEPFRFRGVRCEEKRAGTCPLGPVNLVLGSSPEDIDGITMRPEPEDFEVYWADDGVVLDGRFEAGRRYTVRLPRGLKDEEGQRFEGSRTATVSFRDDLAPGEASLRLSSVSGVFARARDAKIGMLGRRVRNARVRVAVLDAATAEPYLRGVRADDEEPPAWPDAETQATLELSLAGPRDAGHTSHTIDLSRWAGLGDTVLVEVEPIALVENSTEKPKPQRGVFRISGLGVWTHVGPARGVVRVTELDSGRARVGAKVASIVDGVTRSLGTTDRHGMLALPGAMEIDAPAVLVVQTDADGLTLPLRPYAWGTNYRGTCRTDSVGHCHHYRNRYARPGKADPPPKPLRLGEKALVEVGVGRGIYMPGDTVHVAGWAGVSTPYSDYNTRRMPRGSTVALTLWEGGTEIASGEATVNRHGRFFESIRIPEGAALGDYAVEATVLEGVDRVAFAVSEARLPTFELAAAPIEATIIRGATLRVGVTARYLSGEPVPMEQLEWVVECRQTTPELVELDEGFSVSTDADIPWWTRRGRLEGKETSTLQVRLATGGLDHRAARRCEVSVAGQDASAQSVGADTSVLVRPGPGYVALSMASRLHVGDRPVARAMVVDHQGRPIASDSLSIDVRRLEGDSSSRSKRCEAAKAEVGAQARCRLPSLKAGQYRIDVSAKVDGEPLELSRLLWVQARPKVRPPVAAPKPSVHRAAKPTLSVDAPDEVEAGHPLSVKLTAPWSRGEGVLLVEQTGLRRSIPFSVRDGKTTVTVTALEGAGQILELTARMSRPDGRSKRAQVLSATDSVFVRDRAHLQVEIEAPQEVGPGASTSFTVRVEGAQGKPVDARLAVWVVDDAVHQLKRSPRISLEMRFNPHRPLENIFTDMHRELLEPFNPLDFAGRGRRTPRVRAARASVRGAMTVDVRDRFEPAPLFVGDIGTGKDGVVTIPLTVGDDLTRFRIHVIASAELSAGTGPALFGHGGAILQVTTPMPVRAALPRVLRPGDRAEVAAIIGAPADGTVVVRAETAGGRVRVVGPSERTRKVEAGQVVRVPFSAEARRPGEDAITLEATFRPEHGKRLRSAVRRKIAVVPERTAVERAGVYGSVATNKPVAIPIVLPEAQRGSVEVRITSTALGELHDAADYLVDYPYGCVEQTSSRLIPLVAIAGLKDRVPEAPTQIAEAIAHLQSMQRPDGRFSYWPGSEEPSAFGTAYATWVLVMAREAGVMVPKDGLDRALKALQTDVEAPLPESRWGRERALVERVLALRALAEQGPVSTEALARVWAHRERLPVFSRLLLLQVLHRNDPDDPRAEVLLTALSSSIEQRPGSAYVVDPTERRWWWMFSSRARTQAIALMTLQEVAPDDPRIELLANGLKAQRRGGRWRNTQENAFALLALSKYAGVAEAEVPKQRVQAWIGARRVVDAELLGFDPSPIGGAVGLQEALRDQTVDRTHVVLHREGKGRTYYRVGVEWTPQTAPARAQGVSIERRIPHQMRVGDQANIELVLETDAPIHHLAVEVPLPPGLEAVDSRLGAGASARVSGVQRHARELRHYELRPDRVVLFFDTLSPGKARHTIAVTATTPGIYTVPAAVAEAMYEPETRGRTERGTLRVLPQ